MSIPTRVMVMGEDPIARRGLTDSLTAREDVEVVGHLEAGAALPSAVEAVVWDLGPQSHPSLPLAAPESPVLALAISPEAAMSALSWGARGVLPRDVAPDRIAAALHAVTHGFLVVDDTFSDKVIPPRPMNVEQVALTQREHEVLELLALGLSNKEIARMLAFSDHTAKFHVNAILDKLGAAGRTEAVVRAARLGLVAL